MPKGAETFGVSGSSGVEIFMVYDPARVWVPTGKSRWPLDTNVEVTVSVDAASKDLHDLKVRGHVSTVRGRVSHPPAPKHNPITSPLRRQTP